MSHVAINAGDLRQWVTLRTRTKTRDDYGGPKTTDTDSVSKYPARVMPMGGREYQRLGLTPGEVSHVVVMRVNAATTALKTTDAIVLGTRVFEIVTKRNIEERGVYYEFACLETVS